MPTLKPERGMSGMSKDMIVTGVVTFTEPQSMKDVRIAYRVCEHAVAPRKAGPMISITITLNE